MSEILAGKVDDPTDLAFEIVGMLEKRTRGPADGARAIAAALAVYASRQPHAGITSRDALHAMISLAKEIASEERGETEPALRVQKICETLTSSRRRLLHVLDYHFEKEPQRFPLHRHEVALLALIDCGALVVTVTEDALEALASETDEQEETPKGE